MNLKRVDTRPLDPENLTRVIQDVCKNPSNMIRKTAACYGLDLMNATDLSLASALSAQLMILMSLGLGMMDDFLREAEDRNQTIGQVMVGRMRTSQIAEVQKVYRQAVRNIASLEASLRRRNNTVTYSHQPWKRNA